MQYVAAQFERDGLKPAGEQGYIQPVRFISKSLDERKSSVVLVKNGKDTPIKLGDEAIIGTRVDPAASVVASGRSQPTMHLAAPGMYESEGLQLGLTWNPAKADMLLAGTGHTFNELVDLAEAGKPQPHFALNARLKVKTAVKHSELESQNVAAIFPGTDPKLKDEYVVLSGHVDHVGDSGAAINGDHIFNGAMDDAAGTAVILDIAAHPQGNRRQTETVDPSSCCDRRRVGCWARSTSPRTPLLTARTLSPTSTAICSCPCIR